VEKKEEDGERKMREKKKNKRWRSRKTNGENKDMKKGNR
jgi:hypothetical protein